MIVFGREDLRVIKDLSLAVPSLSRFVGVNERGVRERGARTQEREPTARDAPPPSHHTSRIEHSDVPLLDDNPRGSAHLAPIYHAGRRN
jgi:hypothetical protein